MFFLPEISESSKEAWEKFQTIFDVVGDFVDNFEFYQKFLAKLLEAAVEDNVQFLEIRANFTKVNKIESSDQKLWKLKKWIRQILCYRSMTWT